MEAERVECTTPVQAKYGGDPLFMRRRQAQQQQNEEDNTLDALSPRDVHTLKTRLPAQIGKDTSEVINHFLEDDAVRQACNNGVRAIARDLVDTRLRKPKLVVHARMNPVVQETMDEFCSDYDFSCTETDARDHCVSRAVTTVMDRMIDDKIFKLHEKRENVVISHIGENPERLISKGKRQHNCLNYFSSGDARDAERAASLVASLTGRDYQECTPDQRIMIEDYLTIGRSSKGNDTCCNKLFQDCDRPATYIKARNVHDISPRDVAMGMAKKGALLAAGILMYNPVIFLPGINHGALPFCEFIFTKEDGKITFRGPNDSQDAYVHSWKVYSSWFTGKRSVTVRYGGRVHHFALNLKLVAMDHAVWTMVPVAAPVQSKTHSIPVMNSGPLVCIYGHMYDAEHPGYNVFVRPRKEEMMTARYAYVPYFVYRRTISVVTLQKKEFTHEYASRALNTALTSKYRGATYEEIMKYDEDTKQFIASHAYESSFDARYNGTQAVSTVLKGHTDFRGRFDDSFVTKLIQLWNRKRSPNNFRFVIDGKTIEIPEQRMRSMLHFANCSRLLRKIPKDAVMPFKPLLLSSTTAAIFSEDVGATCERLNQALAMSEEAAHLALRDIKGKWHWSLSEYIKKRAAPPGRVFVEGRETSSGNRYARMLCDETHENSCVIDSFVAAHENAYNEGVTYYDVLTRIYRSEVLCMLNDKKAVVDALHDKKMVPLEVLHVIAYEYKCTIKLVKQHSIHVYGQRGKSLWLKCENEHVVPLRQLAQNFPPYTQIENTSADIQCSEEMEVLADTIVNVINRDGHLRTKYGDAYNNVRLLDNAFRDTVERSVLDIVGDFHCDEIRSAFNWRWHLGRSVCEPSQWYVGNSCAALECDVSFWETAVKDPVFRFDAVFFDFNNAVRENLATMSAKLLKDKNSVLAIKFSYGNEVATKALERISTQFATAEIVRNVEASLANKELLAIFRGRFQMDEQDQRLNVFYRAYTEHARSWNGAMNYLRKASIQSESERIPIMRKQFESMVPYEPLESEVAINIAETKIDTIVCAPRDIIFEASAPREDFRPRNNTNKSFRRLFKLHAKTKEVLRAFDSLQTVDVHVARALELLQDENDRVVRMRQTALSAVSEVTPLQVACEGKVKVAEKTTTRAEVSWVEEEDTSHYKESGSDVEACAIKIANELKSCALTTAEEEDFSDDEDEDDPSDEDDEDETYDPYGAAGNVPLTPMQKRSVQEYVESQRELMSECPKVCRSHYNQIEGHIRTLRQDPQGFIDMNELSKRMNNNHQDFIFIHGDKIAQPMNSAISEEYTHVYDALEHQVIAREDFELKQTKRRVGIVIKEFTPYMAPAIFERHRGYEDYSTVGTNFKTIQAVAGGGKTTAIINEFDYENDVIIEATISAKDDVVRRILKQRGEWDAYVDGTETQKRDITKRVRVRTGCSYLLNPFPAKKVWVDEMTLHHAGAIILYGVLSGASEVVCYGDSGQACVFNVIAGKEFRYHKIFELYKPTSKMLRSHRTPTSFVNIIDGLYHSTQVLSSSEKFVTSRNEKGTCEIRTVGGNYAETLLKMISQKSAALNIKPENIAVISFTRSDRQLIARALTNEATGNSFPYNRIRYGTIAQFQGSEAELVILMRTNSANKATGLYTNNHQLLSALTRTRKHFVYMTKAKKDLLSRLLVNHFNLTV
ncbi:MAG: replicase polyprotein (domains: methyltransferase, helicase) [Tomato associated virga-like virus 1]|nr:MAG: replicase polyprotein (domains: methyltransferase, helicase) [Tomato associated virga-like virus 1]